MGGAAQRGPRPWAHSGQWGSCAGLGHVNVTQVQGEAVLASTAMGAGPKDDRSFHVDSWSPSCVRVPVGGWVTLAAGSVGWGVPALSLQRTLNLVQWQ